ncbi:MAG TPA: TIGR00282 family metallophosphoesterase [Oligoflexia bacterium]|nr:TIGR00282 family metallophosphoesterase [Oligoflexia bacterium]
MFNILFLGDIVGRTGRRVVADNISALKEAYQPALIIANGENAAGGLGIDPGTANELFAAGIHIITSGNHIWSKKELIPVLNAPETRIIRPLNYAPGAPGKGSLIWQSPSGLRVAVINVMGRVFLSELLDCPFRAMDAVLQGEAGSADFIIVDVHAEATSEKIAMGYYLDGRVSAVCGTHTHVQTADERLLPQGTAYITDLGMCGPYDSVLGIKPEIIVERFLTGLPLRFDLAKGQGLLNGVVITCDEEKKKAVSIKRVSLVS